jgi:hypothetical protein
MSPVSGAYDVPFYDKPIWGKVEIPKGHYAVRITTLESHGYEKTAVFLSCPECGSQFMLHQEIDAAGQVASVACPFQPCVTLSPVRLLGWSHGKRSGTKG